MDKMDKADVALNHYDWAVRKSAVRELPPEHPARAAACRDEYFEVVNEALKGLPIDHVERIRLCSDPYKFTRCYAVSGLSAEHPERIRLCADPEADVRVNAVFGLSPEHSERIRLCSDPVPRVRKYAVCGLPPEHAERIRLCSDPVSDVREMAVRQLPPDYPDRIRLCSDPDTDVRLAACIRAEKTAPVLRALRQDKNLLIQWIGQQPGMLPDSLKDADPHYAAAVWSLSRGRETLWPYSGPVSESAIRDLEALDLLPGRDPGMGYFGKRDIILPIRDGFALRDGFPATSWCPGGPCAPRRHLTLIREADACLS